jgi:predicted RNase H-like nuclease (RuvC/YqgF family)
MTSENLQEAEEEGYTSPTSNQEEQPSSARPSCYFGDEDPEEHSARYEVISKLADQLAEQIEENDSLLYELGVVRSNNARLQAVAADKEDEVACLTQRNRQLENTITQLNCSQPAEESTAEVLRSQLNQIRGNLCQLLAQGDSKLQFTGHHNQIEIESVNQVRYFQSNHTFSAS